MPCLHSPPKLRAILWSLALLLFTGTAHSEPPLERGGSQDAEVLPPELSVSFDAPYPPDALRDRIEGRVILELLVSTEGKVEAAEVIEGPSASLNEAARAAVMRFEFVPARRGGVPQAARIRYAYDFRLPLEAPPQGSLPEPTTATSSGETDSAPTDNSAPPEEAVVVVRGYRETDRLRRSTAAVTVVDLERAKRESSNMASVLSRAEGVNVQQVGGLGSQARFSLAGFDDTQVRFFIDGIPLEYQGFSLGIQSVPVSFAERVEIYKGVVPIQFGADSLGGAFNVVSDQRTLGTRASASYQAGSFDTARVTAGARHLDQNSGFFVKAESFFDTTDNSYPVDVKVGDATGQSRPVTVNRFHDAYRAEGGNIEVGLVNRAWARRLLLKTFLSRYEQELQHNARMTTPYGEVTYGGLSAGINLRYEHDLGRGLDASFVSGYVYDRSDFVDDPACSYNWLGECVRPRQGSGEVRDQATDQSIWDHTGYLRWNLSWKPLSQHEFGLSTAPTFFARTGKDHLITDPDAFMPLGGKREVFKWITGADYKVVAFAERLENVFFVKNYLHTAHSEERLTGAVTVDHGVQRLYWGAGDGLRYALNDWALAKASYEYSVRLPEPREIFGNGAQIGENLDLDPERSHNLNLTLMVNRLETSLGQFDASATGFYRNARDLILLLGRTDVFFYENVFRARSLGVEGAATWLAPEQVLELGANATYQDFRNLADEGSFAAFEGDRIPNKPYLFANGHARLQTRAVAAPGDELSFTWYTRYVHSFFKTWESVGIEGERPTIDSQLVHSAVVTYANQIEGGHEVSCSVDVQNLTDAKVFDFYGIQRPGRALFVKTVLTY